MKQMTFASKSLALEFKELYKELCCVMDVTGQLETCNLQVFALQVLNCIARCLRKLISERPPTSKYFNA